MKSVTLVAASLPLLLLELAEDALDELSELSDAPAADEVVPLLLLLEAEAGASITKLSMTPARGRNQCANSSRL